MHCLGTIVMPNVFVWRFVLWPGCTYYVQECIDGDHDVEYTVAFLGKRACRLQQKVRGCMLFGFRLPHERHALTRGLIRSARHASALRVAPPPAARIWCSLALVLASIV
jgi:hypothetical protein